MVTPTLILWDIDHTLIETRGVGGELYRAAFEEITGQKMEHKAEITGKPESAILTETLKAHGLEPSDEYQAKYAEALARQYEQHADELRQPSAGERYRVPGRHWPPWPSSPALSRRC